MLPERVGLLWSVAFSSELDGPDEGCQSLQSSGQSLGFTETPKGYMHLNRGKLYQEKGSAAVPRCVLDVSERLMSKTAIGDVEGERQGQVVLGVDE